MRRRRQPLPHRTCVSPFFLSAAIAATTHPPALIGRSRFWCAQNNFWAVLVGGEAPGARHLGSHVSIEYVGQAYSALRRRLGGRARIIVIAQLQEVLDWYETKADMSKDLWRRKKAVRSFFPASTFVCVRHLCSEPAISCAESFGELQATDRRRRRRL
jgi:hypothetical protein